MGKPELADDPRFKTAALRKRNEAALDQAITSWTSERDRWEMTRLLQDAGVAAFPSMSNKDLEGVGNFVFVSHTMKPLGAGGRYGGEQGRRNRG
jgi:hypothetical protein